MNASLPNLFIFTLSCPSGKNSINMPETCVMKIDFKKHISHKALPKNAWLIDLARDVIDAI